MTIAGEERVIGTRAFDLLIALAQRTHRFTTKEELIAAVWPGLVVEENNLAVQIAKLCKLLGRGYITTVAGKGYRLTARPESVRVTENAVGPLIIAPGAEIPLGRHREARSVYTLLSRNRLVTLVGPPESVTLQRA